MRNSALPIPWTHRDSRPRSQAELDERSNSIFIGKSTWRLPAPPHRAGYAARLLSNDDHANDEDPGFAHQVNMATDCYARQKQKRIEENISFQQEKRQREIKRRKRQQREDELEARAEDHYRQPLEVFKDYYAPKPPKGDPARPRLTSST